jgi:HlyD family secretion protein
MSRKIAFMVGLIAALGLGGGLAAVGGMRFGTHKLPYHLEKARVERGDVIGRVTATGTLAALVTVQVGSQVSGRIAELEVDFGDRVKKGQVIASLDPQLFAAAVEQTRANRDAASGQLAQARAKAENAEHQYARARELADKSLISDAELDGKTAKAAAARASVRAAQGELAQAQASLHQAKVNLGYATIVSPISGVVISRNVDVGQTVAASLQAPTLFTIAEDLGKMQVHAAVSEADVGKLQPGLPATFVVDAYPDERFAGVIRQIRDAPQTMQNVVTYDAVLEVDNPDHKLKPGMTANVTFVYAERKNVLRIPSAALRFRPPPDLLAAADALPPGQTLSHKKAHKKDKAKDKDKDVAVGGGAPTSEAAPPPADPRSTAAARPPRTVWALRGERPVEVPVHIGVADGSRVEVVDGDLREGDVLITDAVSRGDRAEAKAEGKKSKGLF